MTLRFIARALSHPPLHAPAPPPPLAGGVCAPSSALPPRTGLSCPTRSKKPSCSIDGWTRRRATRNVRRGFRGKRGRGTGVRCGCVTYAVPCFVEYLYVPRYSSRRFAFKAAEELGVGSWLSPAALTQQFLVFFRGKDFHRRRGTPAASGFCVPVRFGRRGSSS